MKVLSDMESYEDIADAIREKNGETTLYKPREMAEAIRNLSIGTSGALAYKGTVETASQLPESPADGDLYIVGSSTLFWSSADTEWKTVEFDGIPSTQKGMAGGVATLDESGKLTDSQMPDTLELGETSETAYRGDRGKVAYDHAQACGSQYASGLYKVATNAEGHVTDAVAVQKSDITALGIPAQDTTYQDATTTTHGLMSAADKGKIDGIETGAQSNVIESVSVNGTAIAPSGKAVDVTVPTKTSDLANDSDYVSDPNYVHTDANYTPSEKSKLGGIAANATANTASTATPLMDGTASAGSASAYARGDHRHPTDTTRAPLQSPALTGTPTAPTAQTGTDTTQIATTAFVQQEIEANPYTLPTMSATVKGGAKVGDWLVMDGEALCVDKQTLMDGAIDHDTLTTVNTKLAVNIDGSTLRTDSDGHLGINVGAIVYGSTAESNGKIAVVAGTAITSSDTGVSVNYDDEYLDVTEDNELTLSLSGLADGESIDEQSGKLSVRLNTSGGLTRDEDGIKLWLYDGGGLSLHWGEELQVDRRIVLFNDQVAPIEQMPSVSAHAVGEYVIYDGRFHEVTTAIDAEDYSIEDKIEPRLLADVLSDHSNRLSTTESKIEAMQSLRKGADGYYVNESVTAWLARNFDGKIYGYSEPKTTATAITKTGANAGLPNPTLGTLDTEGQSVYRNLGPFQWHACKGHVDSDGVPHIKVIWGVDTLADWQACDEDVWSMRPVIYYSVDESDAVSVNAQVSDTWHQGLKPNPHAYYPDGTLRPYMLAARHGLGFEDGVGVSKPGLKGYGRNVSHNSLITLLKYTSTGYSAKTDYEDWYDKFMFRMIYGTKDSQSVMRGCTGYSYQYHPAVAEQGVKRVILTNAQADSLVIGSTMMMGNQATASTDRNNANCYNVFDGLVIASIEEYDSSRKAVYFDTDATFDTDPAYLLSTAPWHTGSCGDMDWDGTPTAAGAHSGKEPMFFQGCELMNGNYEILGNVILSSDGESGWIPYVNPDTKAEKTALSSDYVSCETSLPVDNADSWKYPLYLSERSGMMYGTQTGGSQSTGICDGHYTNKVSTAGTREWRSLGNLSDGGGAGLAFVRGNVGLGGTGWDIWSRLSGVGRSRAAA